MKENQQKKKKNKRIIKIIATDTLMICLAGISFTSAYKLYRIGNTYRINQEEYNNLSKEVEEEIEEGKEETIDIKTKEEPKQKEVKIDFNKLKQKNSDTKGWIKYEDTLINYPIVQGKDNDEYLDKSFEGNSSTFGTLFIDSRCNEPFKDFTTIIYGHNMKNGSMFGGLKKLKKEEYYKEHPELELFTEDKNYQLEICAFLNQSSDCKAYTINIETEEEKKYYIDTIKKLALYQTDTDITTEDKLVILSTCSYEFTNARYIVICKLVEQNKYNKAQTPYPNNTKKLIRKLY